MKYKFIVILFLLIILYIVLSNTETFTTISNEGIQSLSSVYNNGSISVNNVITQSTITTNGNANIGGDLILTGKFTSGVTDTTKNPDGIIVNGRIHATDRIKTNDLYMNGSICVGPDDTHSVCIGKVDLFRMLKAYTLRDKMYNNGAVIYNNILSALASNIIVKSGNPASWDSTTYTASNLWNGQTILNIGSGANSFPNGLTINFDKTMMTATSFDDFSRTLWVRCLSDRWIYLRLYDESGNLMGGFCSGKRNLTAINPNGSPQDTMYNLHMWFPIPIPFPIQNSYTLTGMPSGGDAWLSGIAFNTNPWNHAMNSALAYTWAVNGGSAIPWNNDNWNNDVLAILPQNVVSTLMVPIVWSSYDKLVYIVEHNNNWLGVQHNNVKVNGTQIENFRTTYTNPFATHFNSKIYNRYIAARIPNNLIKQSDKFITLTIDMTPCNNHMYIREVGTHDYL